MEKVEAVSKLKKAGYQVQFDSSVVTVVLPPKVNTNQEIKKLKSFLAEIGYDSSFGIKQLKGKYVEEKKEIQESEIVLGEEVIFDTDVSENPEDRNSADNFEEELVEIGEQFSLEDFGIS